MQGAEGYSAPGLFRLKSPNLHHHPVTITSNSKIGCLIRVPNPNRSQITDYLPFLEIQGRVRPVFINTYSKE